MQEVSVDRSAVNLPSVASQTPGVTRRPLASEVTDRALQAARMQQDLLARRLRSVSAAAHRSAGEMEGQQDWIASAIHALASEVDGLASRISDQDVRDLMLSVRAAAQRKPAMFIGASLLAGFAVGRIIKMTAAEFSRGDMKEMARG